MIRKDDARVIKTKSKLLTTFKTLLSEKSFEDITVNEICDKSDVRRATFYKHFADKYAFLKYLIGSLRNDFDNRIGNKKMPDATSVYYVEYLHSLVNFLTENENMVKNVLKSEVLPSLMEVIKEKNYEDTCERLKKSVAEGMTLPTTPEICASMMTGAVASTLLSWFKGGKTTPVGALIKGMCAVIQSMQNQVGFA